MLSQHQIGVKYWREPEFILNHNVMSVTMSNINLMLYWNAVPAGTFVSSLPPKREHINTLE